MKKQQSQKEQRQRKFLLVLPVLIVPFLTLMFWALGGGSVDNASAQTAKKEGINMKLPGAKFGLDKPEDKMGYYDHAYSDSEKLKELMKNDPYYSQGMAFNEMDSSLAGGGVEDTLPPKIIYGPATSYQQGVNETNIYRKLEKLDAALKAGTQVQEQEAPMYQQPSSGINTADVNRLEQMMQRMNQGSSNDPELQQLDGMLQNIKEIQHPELVKEKMLQASKTRKGHVLPVTHARKAVTASLLTSTASAQHRAGQNGFFSFDNSIPDSGAQNAIEAVIHERQVAVNGSTVKLRLLNDVFINGVVIPKNNFIYGIASLKGERLRIQVSGIQYAKSLFPVSLDVYDMDGINGIYIPGAISRDVAKQSTERSMQNIGISAIDGSWQGQAAGAGVEAAKTLFSKKLKLVKVTLRAGYKVLLYDEKQKQEN